MVREIPAFVAADGTIFDEREDAEAYEVRMLDDMENTIVTILNREPPRKEVSNMLSHADAMELADALMNNKCSKINKNKNGWHFGKIELYWLIDAIYGVMPHARKTDSE